MRLLIIIATAVPIFAVGLFLCWTICASYGWIIAKVIGLDSHAGAMAGGGAGTIVAYISTVWKKAKA